MKRPNLPLLHGVPASRLYLPKEAAFLDQPLIHYLSQKFPHIAKTIWQQRFDQGKIFDEQGNTLTEHSLYRYGTNIYYYREIADEANRQIPFTETILAVDEHLIVVDKPHFLPVIPSGQFVGETLLTRLRKHPALQHLKVADIAPIHRLDKDTAGVMLFSHQAHVRGIYQQLFAKQAVQKTYHAIAKTNHQLDYPLTYQSKIVRGQRFFLSQETTGVANAITIIQPLADFGAYSRYQLQPLTGKKHQLRLHMNALDMPILYDRLYPDVCPMGSGDYQKPLQLLAKTIGFIDPISRQYRQFESQQDLLYPLPD